MSIDAIIFALVMEEYWRGAEVGQNGESNSV